MHDSAVRSDAVATGVTNDTTYEQLVQSIHGYGGGRTQWDGDPQFNPRTKSTLRPLLPAGMYAADANVRRDEAGNVLFDPGIEAADGTLVRRASDTAYDDRLTGGVLEAFHAVLHGEALRSGEMCEYCGEYVDVDNRLGDTTENLMRTSVSPSKRSSRSRSKKPVRKGDALQREVLRTHGRVA